MQNDTLSHLRIETQAEATVMKRGQKTAEAAAVVERTAEVRIDNQPLLVFQSLRIAETGISEYWVFTN